MRATLLRSSLSRFSLRGVLGCNGVTTLSRQRCTSSELYDYAASSEVEGYDPHETSVELAKAVVPTDMLAPQLLEEHTEKLDALYSALMSPLESMPTQRERVAALASINTSRRAFFARRQRTLESYELLIRSLGVKGELKEAKTAFLDMIDFGLTPTPASFAAMADACARSADMKGVHALIRMMEKDQLRPTAPIYTSLIGAYRRADRPTDEIRGLLDLVRRKGGGLEDAPLHTALICVAVERKEFAEAWEIFGEMREHGVAPDAVTFTAMIQGCAVADQFEKAQSLWEDMRKSEVFPTLATHNVFINACAARVRALADLTKERRSYLRKIAVDINPESPLKMAFRQVERLREEGHEPDDYTYHALMRACRGAGDVSRAQRLLTRMLDSGVQPHSGHFHTLLQTCVRGQRLRHSRAEHDEHIAVATSVPPSMLASGLEVTGATLDLVLMSCTKARRVHESLQMMDDLYAEYGMVPTAKACQIMLQLSHEVKRGDLAFVVLARMDALGLEVDEDMRQLPVKIETPVEYLDYQRLPPVAWSLDRGYFDPAPSRATIEKNAKLRRAALPSIRLDDGGVMLPPVYQGMLTEGGDGASSLAGKDRQGSLKELRDCD